MTVATTNSGVPYALTGSVGPFPITFPFVTGTDIAAMIIDLFGNETILNNGIDFTVTGGAVPGSSIPQTGVLTLSVAGPNGDTLFINRGNMTATQQDSLPTQGTFSAKVVEAALDRLTLLAQNAQAGIAAAISIPLVESLAGITTNLPSAAQRASRVSGFDSLGNTTTYPQSVGTVTFTTVATLAALRSAAAPTGSVVMQLQGYYAAGDGIDSRYYWDPVSVIADNGGTVIQITGIATGRWRLIMIGNRTTLKQWGAKGDGSTVDTVRIQAALTWGGNLQAPAGTYVVGLLTGGSAVTSFTGDGPSISQFNVTQAVTVSTSWLTLTSLVRAEIGNFSVSMSAATYTTQPALTVTLGTQCDVHDIEMASGGGKTGIVLNNTGGSLRNCFVNGQGLGVIGILATACAALTIDNCSAAGQTTYGIEMDNCNNVICTNCNQVADGASGGFASIFGHICNDLIINACSTSPQLNNGIQIEGCVRFTVSDCSVACGGSHVSHGLLVTGILANTTTSQNGLITGNRISNSGRAGIALVGQVNNVHVVGNSILNPSVSGVGAVPGIYLSGGTGSGATACQFNTVDGNRLLDNNSNMQVGVSEINDGSGVPGPRNWFKFNTTYGAGLVTEFGAILGASSRQFMSAFTAFTPVFSSSVGSGIVATINVAEYKFFGDMIFITVTATITAIGTASGLLLMTVPTTTLNTGMMPGRNGATAGQLQCGVQTASSIYIVSSGGAFPVVAGNQIIISGFMQH